jgi:hypothetical protein
MLMLVDSALVRLAFSYDGIVGSSSGHIEGTSTFVQERLNGIRRVGLG